MSTLSQKSENFIYKRLLFSMSAEEKESFTDMQLIILQKACLKLAPRKHRVNIRMSIPIPYWPDIYFVLLAGEEKRGATRTRQERQLFWRAFIAILGVLTLLASILFSTPTFVSRVSNLMTQPSSSTALPWIDTEADCTKFDRIWDKEACWDKQHDPNF